MRAILLVLFVFFELMVVSQDLRVPFELGKANETLTYQQCIDLYRKLARKYPKFVKIQQWGETDCGEPLQTVLITANANAGLNPANQKAVVFINNGIHPGEPEGIDASFILARTYLENPELRARLKQLAIIIVPIYNIDGALMRNKHSRANQLGPDAYGFRGNARNLDLNRDFIKMDSKNSKAWIDAFTTFKPHLLIDNHTSNGADYPYTLTYIATQHNKLNPILQPFLQSLESKFVSQLKVLGIEAVPYVYTLNEIPDNGIVAFLETPRYATGFAALHNCLGFTIETHMLKPFNLRLLATLKSMEVLLKLCFDERLLLIEKQHMANDFSKTNLFWPTNFLLDRNIADTISFNTYAPKYKKSEVTSMQRLYYDAEVSQTLWIPFYKYYKPTDTTILPKFFVLPKSEYPILERLQWNKVAMHRLQKDTLLNVTATYILDFKTVNNPYENHYLHFDTQVRKEQQQIIFKAGDYIVYCNQYLNQFIAETLNPIAVDSYFNWNFFDGFMQRKEYFSDYVFEDLAAELLAENPALKADFETAKKTNPNLQNNAKAQLNWIYNNSIYAEKSYRRLPYFEVN